MPNSRTPTVEEVVTRFGGVLALADHLGFQPVGKRGRDREARIKRWVERGRIPVEYFNPLLSLAGRLGVSLTMQELVDIAVEKPRAQQKAA